MTPKQRKLLAAIVGKPKGGGDLPYTPLPDGVKCFTGEEFIDTGVSWKESCVWEITAYLQGTGFFKYGYTSGGVTDVRSQEYKYQLGSVVYNPLQGTDITTSAKSIYTYTVIDETTKKISAKLEVQGVTTEAQKENSYIDGQNFRIGKLLYTNATINMVIQEVKRTMNGIVTHDYIACDYNGQLGMWDRVTDTFIANSGAGEFVLP